MTNPGRFPDDLLRSVAEAQRITDWSEQMHAEQEAMLDEFAADQAEERAEQDHDRELARRDWEESQREREAMAAEREAMAEERRRMDAERARAEADRQAAAEQRERDEAEVAAEKRRQVWRWVITTVIALVALGVSLWGQVKPDPAHVAPPAPPAVSAPAPAPGR